MRELTKEAKILVRLIYVEFSYRINSGLDKQQAKNFTDPCNHPSSFRQTFSERDLTDTLSELHNAGLIKKYIRDSFVLSDQGIAYMERSLFRKLSKISKTHAKKSHSKPSATHTTKSQDDTNTKTLFWTKTGVIVAIIFGVLSIAVPFVIWWIS